MASQRQRVEGRKSHDDGSLRRFNCPDRRLGRSGECFLKGLQVGRAAASLIWIRCDLLRGVTLIIAAVALPLVFGG
jgi:hypothetical protein